LSSPPSCHPSVPTRLPAQRDLTLALHLALHLPSSTPKPSRSPYFQPTFQASALSNLTPGRSGLQFLGKSARALLSSLVLPFVCACSHVPPRPSRHSLILSSPVHPFSPSASDRAAQLKAFLALGEQGKSNIRLARTAGLKSLGKGEGISEVSPPLSLQPLRPPLPTKRSGLTPVAATSPRCS
jgi:hypothetical protein